MKMLRVPLLMIGLLLCSQGFAATAQQNKMSTCNADATAKTLKGAERKAFMSTCLKAAPAATPAATPAVAPAAMPATTPAATPAVAPAVVPAATPAATAKKMTPQQEKMKTCNASAGTQALKGDARKAFMSDCLKKK